MFLVRKLIPPFGVSEGLLAGALVFTVMSGVARIALGTELHLRLEPTLSDPERAVSADPGGATVSAPFVLGLTNLSSRVEHARQDAEAWQEVNQVLSAHLAEREKHLGDLRSFVVLQDDTIGALETQKNTLAELEPALPPLRAASEDPASQAVAVPVAPNPSPYLEVGLVSAIVVVLAWALYLRAQVRARDRDLAAASPRLTPHVAPILERELPARVPRVEHDAAPRPEASISSSGSADFDLVIGESDDEPDEFGETLVLGEAPGEIAAAPTSRSNGRTNTDADALKEVDTLIAFEDLEGAAALLEKLLRVEPRNPEYRLRLLHILSSTGDLEASAEQERLLESMMDAPLSETLARVQRIGRDLLPGHRLFGSAADGTPREAALAERDT